MIPVESEAVVPATLPRPAESMPAWSRTARRADALLELQLCAELPLDWSLQFTRGLARRGAGLQSGRARRIGSGLWLAKLVVDDRQTARLDAVDFLALGARPQPGPDWPEPPILDFELQDSPDRPGLQLEVHAWDGVGLLAAVLGRAAAAGLLARELLLETEEECAFHRLDLCSSRGVVSSRRQRRALALGMAALLL